MTGKISVSISTLLASFISIGVSEATPELGTLVSLFEGAFSPNNPNAGILEGTPNAYYDYRVSYGTDFVSDSVSSTFGGSSFVGIVSASSGYGVLGAFASAAITDYPAGDHFLHKTSTGDLIGQSAARAVARFKDTLTLSGGSGNAFLGLEFNVTGSSSVTSGGFPTDTWGYLRIYDPSDPTTLFGFGDFGGDTTVTAMIPFTFDQPFSYGVLLRAGFDPLGCSFGPCNVSGISDFGNTATLTSFRAYSDFDLQHEITNFVLDSESGTDYRLFNVPEPGSGTLIVTFLPVVLAFRLNRKRFASTTTDDCG